MRLFFLRRRATASPVKLSAPAWSTIRYGSCMLATYVDEFIQLLKAGDPLAAMNRFYSEEVNVFENRELARAGKKRCLEFERTQLTTQPRPPQFSLSKYAVNPSPVDADGGYAFLEYCVRFFDREGHAMRLEEVAVQVWERGHIVQERFYYDGAVDEGGD